MAQEGFFVADPRSWAAAPSVPRRDPSDAAAPCDPRDRVERLEGVNAKVGYFVSPVGLRVDSKITKGVHRNVRYFGLSVFFLTAQMLKSAWVLDVTLQHSIAGRRMHLINTSVAVLFRQNPS
jgi:hypothetical protein